MTILFGNTAAAAVGLITRFLGDADVDSVTMKVENSPWVQFDVWVHMEGEFKFALWRSSGSVYLVGPDGAVGDDPVPSLTEVLHAEALRSKREEKA
jgi:hypothetical protein